MRPADGLFILHCARMLLMAVVEVQCYLNRARDFLKGMDLLQSDLAEYRSSSALLGIHCAISYGDALRTGLSCKQLSSEDHRRAADDLESLLHLRNFKKPQGTKHLKILLAKKTRVSYAAEAVRENEVEEIVKSAKRFANWAEETGKALKIEGWLDD